MKYEIAIEGPPSAIKELMGQMGTFSPVMKKAPLRDRGKRDEGMLLIVESGHAQIDETLLGISRIITGVEKALCLKKRFDIRVRNLAYSEPTTGSSQFSSPFKPIDSITIRPWTPSSEKPGGGRTIILDPHHAFGTGKHPTTRLCLKIMDLMARNTSKTGELRAREVLDFGCGTGLLAIAAVKMGAGRALGVEIDRPSAQAAQRNVELNHLTRRIEIREGSWGVVNAKYDLILANLVTSALLRTGKEIPHHLKDHGQVVVSGFGDSQTEEIRRSFSKTGLVISRKMSLEGWGAFVMEKGPSP